MDPSFVALSTGLMAGLLLRNRERGKAAIASSDFPDEVKFALTTAFDGSTSNEEAIRRVKDSKPEIVRAAGGILDWLHQSYVGRQQRRSDVA